MDIQNSETILNQKEAPDLYELVEPVLENPELCEVLVDGCFSRDETYRFNCVRVFFRALEKRPDLFYPYWERYAGMVASPNSFYRSTAAQAIAFFVSVDEDQQIDSILEDYLLMLDDDKVMVSRYFAQTIHLLPEARPDLRQKVIACLLDVENTRHTQSRKSLLKADIIGAFDQLFDSASTQQQLEILAFVEKERDNESPTTRKAAKAFLNKHP